MFASLRNCAPRTVRIQIGAVLLSFAMLAQAQSKPQSEFLGSLLNQKMILMHLGEQKEYRLSKGNLNKLTSHCDVAVKLTKDEWVHGTARLWFEDFGTPFFPPAAHISPNSYAPLCKMRNGPITLQISGFSAAEDEDAVSAILGQILLTPEEYMSLHGVPFNFAPAPNDQAGIECKPPMKMPRLLLNVEPDMSEEARKAKYQGTTVLAIVVGTDGRVRNPHIVRKLGMGLDEAAMEALSTWRFEPGRNGDKPVACKLNVEVSFHIY